MAATCKCVNGHTFRSRVVEDDPTTNSFELEDYDCPECGTDDFEVLETYDEFNDIRDM